MKRIFSVLVVMIMCAGLLFAGDQRNTAAETVDQAQVSDAVSQPVVPVEGFTPPSTEAVLYSNGPLLTHPGGGFGGAGLSQLQTNLLLTIFGFGHQGGATNNKVGDDFTIADEGGWTVDSLCFWAYQTGSTTTSTITSVKWELYDTDPSVGGAVPIASDSATIGNGRLATSWSGMYRATNTTPLDALRPIMYNRCNVEPNLSLAAGQYWLVWQATGTLTSGPWCPPISIVGTTVTGDGIQYIGATPLWQDLLDTGPEPDAAQGVPFEVKGSVNATGIPCDAFTALIARCLASGGGTVQARVTMLNSTQYAGEVVTFQVDEDVYPATIVTNGTHSRAQISVPGAGAGPHTVTLIDPAGCFGPFNVNCPANKVSGEWEADDARWAEGTTETNVVPSSTTLRGNYPNPFNPSTTIRYALAADTYVSVKVYNMLGQEVATLVDGFQKAGEQSVIWNGTNNAGSTVASGLYIYKLQAGSVVLSEKMLFAK
jgi:hypothetical protein